MTGASPIVDVRNTQRTHVINRDLLDSLPTARNYSGLAALMPGVRMTNADVGFPFVTNRFARAVYSAPVCVWRSSRSIRCQNSGEGIRFCDSHWYTTARPAAPRRSARPA